jgi:hypothetical protein
MRYDGGATTGRGMPARHRVAVSREDSMGRWSRSWAITRTSMQIIQKDREMLWFPVLATLFSILFSVSLIVPTLVLDVFGHVGPTRAAVGPLQVVVLFATYFGLAFIATFFNVCVVYTTRVRLEGGDATFSDSIKFAFSRLHLIAAWSLVSATVGILLHALEAIAERAGLAGKILLWVLRAVLATAWSLMTVFVIPSMVYRELGPFDAMRDSVDTLKRTWGEGILGYFGVGIAGFVCMLGPFALFAGGIVLAGQVPAAGLALCALGALGFVGVLLFFGVISTVYKTVLYHWATTQTVPAGYDADALVSAFRR